MSVGLWPEWANLVDERELIVSEMFGPTIQGEGRSSGTPAMFLRLGMCNLDCVWCDTPYTWDWTGKNGTAFDKTAELHRERIGDIIEWLIGFDVDLVVVSGGEPLIQAKHLSPLINTLTRDYSRQVEIETNGTLSPNRLGPAANIVKFNVSPKLAGSGCGNARLNIDALNDFAALDSTFKFVVSSDTDIAEVEHIIAATDIQIQQVWLMPEGRTASQLDRNLGRVMIAAVSNGYNVTDRLHVRAYGDRRGV